MTNRLILRAATGVRHHHTPLNLMTQMHNDYCAIDFGTSNSAIAIPDAHLQGGMKLAAIEADFVTMPTAIFYNAEDGTRAFGRAAIQAYVDGFDGRLMRSIKSILGADLIDETTDIGHGITIKYIDVVIHYLRQLKQTAELAYGQTLNRVIIGRPVKFVDDNETRDKSAEAALCRAAIAAGFREVNFQFEPIAAALDYESTINAEEIVMVADIGGGTSDFSIVRVGGNGGKSDGAKNRQDDILANHGVHIAGTDFDQAVNIAAIMPSLGLGSLGPASQYHRRVPSKIYFDLATWHLINTVYSHNRLIELRDLSVMYADRRCFERLTTVVTKRLGHALAAKAEEAKINVATRARATITLDEVEENLAVEFAATAQAEALTMRVNDIVNAAIETARRAKLDPAEINTLYFTGGSTGLTFLTEKIAAQFPKANIAVGDRFASVATGLGLEAVRQYGVQHL
jgi:hypothetical chaperone protein